MVVPVLLVKANKHKVFRWHQPPFFLVPLFERKKRAIGVITTFRGWCHFLKMALDKTIFVFIGGVSQLGDKLMPTKQKNQNKKSARFNIRGDREVIEKMNELASVLGVSASELWIESAERRLKNSDLDELRDLLKTIPEVLADRLTEEMAKSLDDIGQEVRLTAGKHLDIARASQAENRKDMNKLVEEMFEMTKRVQQIAEVIYQTATQSDTTKTAKSGGGGSVLSLKDLQTR